MELLIAFSNLVLLLVLLGLQFNFNKKLFKMLKENNSSKYFEDSNLISKINDEDIEFSQENPLDLPKNVKVEVEGGDVLSPYEIN